MFKVLFRETGFTGILKFMWKTAMESKKMKSHDWSGFEAKHKFSKENIYLLLEGFATMKALIDMTNEEKARGIASDMLKNGNDHITRKFNENVSF